MQGEKCSGSGSGCYRVVVNQTETKVRNVVSLSFDLHLIMTSNKN